MAHLTRISRSVSVGPLPSHAARNRHYELTCRDSDGRLFFQFLYEAESAYSALYQAGQDAESFIRAAAEINIVEISKAEYEFKTQPVVE